MATDPTASGAMPTGRPDPATVHEDGRDFHHEGVPSGEDADAKGGPGGDDRLAGETAHANQTGDDADDGATGNAPTGDDR